MKKDIYNQIKNITSSLIQTSFVSHYNFPSDKGTSIIWSGFKDISFALKNVSYEELYIECLKENAYNFILLDGAIIQMMFEFTDNNITKQRLAFYPKPNSERFQDAVDDFEELYYGNNLFADVFDKHVVVFPLRIDFDQDAGKYVECDHTYVHMTLGNYKNCRIPISKPLSPNKFILFILRSFYFNRFNQKYTNQDFSCDLLFDELLTKNEKKLCHFSH